LWHGANWKFVVWGSMHGLGLAVHKALSGVLNKIPNVFPVKFISWFLTFVFVITLWVFFRAVDVPETTVMKTVKNASNFEYFSKTISETDTSKSISVYFTENKIVKDTITETLNFKYGEKVLISEKIKGNDKEISIKIMIGAYKAAYLMIKQVVTDTDFVKYAPAFYRAQTLWVILMLVGIAMHASPKILTEGASNLFIKSPWIVKLLIFTVVVQLVIQLKSEDVVPFIYFQF